MDIKLLGILWESLIFYSNPTNNSSIRREPRYFACLDVKTVLEKLVFEKLGFIT